MRRPALKDTELNLLLDISNEIAKAMQAKRMRASTLAKRSGLDPRVVAAILDGSYRHLRLHDLVTIAHALGCRLEVTLVDARTDEWDVKRAIARVVTSAPTTP